MRKPQRKPLRFGLLAFAVFVLPVERLSSGISRSRTESCIASPSSESVLI